MDQAPNGRSNQFAYIIKKDGTMSTKMVLQGVENNEEWKKKGFNVWTGITPNPEINKSILKTFSRSQSSRSIISEDNNKNNDGVCGKEKNTCSSGTLNTGTYHNTPFLWKWQCKGKGNGANAYCEAKKTISIIAECGKEKNTCKKGEYRSIPGNSGK